MDEPNRFERLLGDLSTRFTGVATEAVERALHMRGELLATDRTTLFEFSPDGTALRATHTWAHRGPSWSVVCAPVRARVDRAGWRLRCSSRAREIA